MNLCKYLVKFPVVVPLWVIILDQATKHWAEKALTLHEPVSIFQGFNLTLVYNFGAAFGFLSNANGWQRWFFLAIAVLVIGMVINWLKDKKIHCLERLALLTLLGGAIGNLIDRLVNGCVVDFLDFYLNDWHWPAFNVADIAISVSAVVLVFMMMRSKK